MNGFPESKNSKSMGFNLGQPSYQFSEPMDTKQSNDLESSDIMWLKAKKIPQQNIAFRLRDREMHNSRPGTEVHVARRMHTNIYPNFTVMGVDKPPCFLRKFSPDGKYFIAFSADQMSLEVYEFQGSAAAERLLDGVGGEYLAVDPSDQHGAMIRSQIFWHYFKLRQTTHVASNNESLNRECSLFTDDGRYVIIGSAVYVPEDPYPHFFDIYRNNESVTPSPRSPLEDYTLYSVELDTGRLCDMRKFKVDKIFLSHNQGLYLYKDTLAVLSVQQQTIHIFQVTRDGCFVDVRTIGRFCYEDDLFVIQGATKLPQLSRTANTPATPSRLTGRPNSSPSRNLRGTVSSTTTAGCSTAGSAPQSATQHPKPPTQPDRPFNDFAINCLKHRLLTHLFQSARAESERTGATKPLFEFYRHFDEYQRLRMWKMQLLDEGHLLIKYASEDVVALKLTDPSSQPSFFVVYNMISTEVLAVYENTSEELLDLFERFCDLLRNASLHSETQFTCSASSNVHARQIHERFKQTIVSARFGGQTEAIRRMLAQLPISAQSYSSSPYLDLALFSYDDKWVSVMERPKACGDHPIRFYARDSGLLRFKIHTGVVGGKSPPMNARRLVAFTFHPSESFAISVQRTNAEYVVNFHVRHFPAS